MVRYLGQVSLLVGGSSQDILVYDKNDPKEIIKQHNAKRYPLFFVIQEECGNQLLFFPNARLYSCNGEDLNCKALLRVERTSFASVGEYGISCMSTSRNMQEMIVV
jgi:hypothetical protein